jgi:hypothetical protein
VKRRGLTRWFGMLAAGCLLACSSAEEKAPAAAATDPVEAARQAGYTVGYIGVNDIAEGDTLNDDPGLTIIERSVSFPAEADGGEAFAWEFYAESLKPVKLVLFRENGDRFELVGESRLVVPRQLGSNRLALREPIPLEHRYKFGIIQPEEGVVPFRRVRNWKTMITTKSLERPFMHRDRFSVYGWRYAVRVFWRQGEQ